MRLLCTITFVGLIASLFSGVVRAATTPSPLPKPLRKGPPVVIQGNAPLPPAPTFDLMAGSATLKTSGTLIIRFRALNASQELSTTAPLVIDLYGSGKMTIKPFQIMRKAWKPGLTQVTVQYSGALAKKRNTIRGDAAFTVCKKGTKVCNKVKKDDLVFSFVPSS